MGVKRYWKSPSPLLDVLSKPPLELTAVLSYCRNTYTRIISVEHLFESHPISFTIHQYPISLWIKTLSNILSGDGSFERKFKVWCGFLTNKKSIRVCFVWNKRLKLPKSSGTRYSGVTVCPRWPVVGRKRYLITRAKNVSSELVDPVLRLTFNYTTHCTRRNTENSIGFIPCFLFAYSRAPTLSFTYANSRVHGDYSTSTPSCRIGPVNSQMRRIQKKLTF